LHEKEKNQFLAVLVATAKMLAVKVGILIDPAYLPCQPAYFSSLMLASRSVPFRIDLFSFLIMNIFKNLNRVEIVARRRKNSNLGSVSVAIAKILEVLVDILIDPACLLYQSVH
jgi:hypothetical protein